MIMPANLSLDRAETYLERERDILLSGRIKELAGLADTRAAVLSTLAGASGDAARIKRLRAMAARNGTLLAASAHGVNRALKRLKELRKATGPIGSYSATGGPCEIGSINPQFERKA